MKRVVKSLLAVVLCLAMTCPVFADGFAISIEYKPAPEIVVKPGGIIGNIWDPDGNPITDEHEDCIIVTPLADAKTTTQIPREAADLLIEVYNQLISGEVKLSDVPGLDEIVKDALGDEYDANDLVIKDLFDITALCSDIKTHLPKEDYLLDLTFDIGVSADTFVQAMVYIDGQWQLIDRVINNGDGTITCFFEDICPVAFLVPEDAATGNDAINTGDVNASQIVMWSVLAGASLLAMVAAFVVYRRKMAE